MKFRYTLVFLFGFLVCLGIVYTFEYFNVRQKIPFGTGLVGLENLTPFDRVPEEDIIVFEDRVILKVSGVTLSNYAEGGSMSPLLDKGSNGIRVVPENEEDVNVGDIVSYLFDGILVVHRVVEKGIDDEGVYFITQGDSNLVDDGKIRFEDIRYITIGIIY